MMFVVKYSAAGVVSELEFNGENSILDVLIDNEVENVNYMCREGYCGYCKCVKTNGIVEYTEEPLVVLNDDEFLPCISTPKSDVDFINLMDMKKPD